MKKNIISMIISSIAIFSVQPAIADSVNLTDPQLQIESSSINIDYKNFDVESVMMTESKNLKSLYLKNKEFFVTNERNQADLEMESMIIEGFKSSVFNKKETLSKEDYDLLLNGYFVDALKSGHRNLADEILFNSGAEIDVNFISDNPRNTPLMALATSFAYDGGDIEYFVKLVKMGADYSYIIKKSNIPLMSLAANVDNYKIVLYLIGLGENPMHLDNFDYYPLDYSIKNGSDKTTLILTTIISEYKKEYERKHMSE